MVKVAVWHRLKASLWALPTLLVVTAVIAGFALVELQAWVPESLVDDWPALLGAGADGSRAMLTAIAGSMVTVAGVVFSITLVVLSLASRQYSPRVLRSFLADRANQGVLGVFLGVYAYCLVVLRSIRNTDEGAFVPALAVLFGIVLAFVGIAVLIFFIHHVATSIQATSIMERIADETISCLQRPTMAADDAAEAEPGAVGAEGPWVTACAPRRGYVASIDYGELERLAEAANCTIRVERGVGEFAIAGQPLVSIAGRGAGAPDMREAAVRTFQISRQRTAELDPAFGVRQLADVALKALSSGASDPTTASTAIDYLTAVLVEINSARGGTHEDVVRRRSLVQRRSPTFADLLQMSFGEIRQAAHGNLATLSAMERSLSILDEVTRQPQRRRALLQQALGLRDATSRADLSTLETASLSLRVERRIRSLSDPARGDS